MNQMTQYMYKIIGDIFVKIKTYNEKIALENSQSIIIILLYFINKIIIKMFLIN